MPAELVSCPECKRKLRVPDELIGKLVKCPTCGQTFNADPATQPPLPEPPPPPREEKPALAAAASLDWSMLAVLGDLPVLLLPT